MRTDLTAEQLREILDYDPETGVLTWRADRGNVKKGSEAGAARPDGYKRIGINYVRYLSHRLAWLHYYGEWPAHFIDHVNGNPSDNRISNLREATQFQNMRNAARPSKNKSGAKGVSFMPRYNKWAVQIRPSDKKNSWQGLYETFEEACDAARALREELHGEFARHE